MDDRWLYWKRISLLRYLHAERTPGDLLRQVDRASRGFSAAQDDGPCIVVTGFDPFRLDANIAQSNPSGLVALSLAGSQIAGMRVEAGIFPVRFDAFDMYLVEEVFRRYLDEADVRMIVTVGMGRDAFDLERFPAGRRSSEDLDNIDDPGFAGSRDLAEDHDSADMQFVEFSLPAEAMVRVSGRWPVRDNREVETIEGGQFRARSLDALRGHTPLMGSGGDHLSSEVAYRALRIRDRHAPGLAVGHIHTPHVDGWDVEMELEIVEQTRHLIAAAAATLR